MLKMFSSEISQIYTTFAPYRIHIKFHKSIPYIKESLVGAG